MKTRLPSHLPVNEQVDAIQMPVKPRSNMPNRTESSVMWITLAIMLLTITHFVPSIWLQYIVLIIPNPFKTTPGMLIQINLEAYSTMSAGWPTARRIGLQRIKGTSRMSAIKLLIKYCRCR